MLFVSLLSQKGKGREALKHLMNLKSPPNITVHGIYLTFGRYDGLIIFEALDMKTALLFVMDKEFSTDFTVETLTALPVDAL